MRKTITSLAFVSLAIIALIAQTPTIVSPGGLTIMVDGNLVGTFTSLIFTSGNGIVWASRPNGSTLNLDVGMNTGTVVSKTILQSGACTFLNSTNGTVNYTFDLGPSCQALNAYAIGQRFWLKADVPCPANCWLQIENLAQINIKRSDGTTDPGGLFDFTQGVPIWYDGTVFRIEWQH